MAELTPMMQQYMQIKEQNKDSILFYRLGDFYEMFFDDAKVASQELELVLTGRDCGLEERAPMCGVPFHSCGQLHCQIDRQRLQSGHLRTDGRPGHGQGAGEAGCDPHDHAGHGHREQHAGRDPEQLHLRHLPRQRRGGHRALATCPPARCRPPRSMKKTSCCQPAERAGPVSSPARQCCLDGAYSDEKLVEFLKARLGCHVEHAAERTFLPEAARQMAARHFDLSGGLEEACAQRPQMLQAVGGLLAYLHETQKNDLKHIKQLEVYAQAQYMKLDPGARRNLELCQVMRSGGKRGSLLWVLDHTKTAMGRPAASASGWKSLWSTSPRSTCGKTRWRPCWKNRPGRDGILEGLQGVLRHGAPHRAGSSTVRPTAGICGPWSRPAGTCQPSKGRWMAFAASTWRSCASRSIRWPTWPS